MESNEWNVHALRPDEVDKVSARLGLARLSTSRGSYVVAWDGAVPVGHLHLWLGDPPQIQDVEVHPDARRQGVARVLVRTSIVCATDHGASVLRLTVGSGNDGARALYHSLGFAPTNLPSYRVTGVVTIRTGPIHVDDVLSIWERPLP